eukprot:GSA25T00000498001.1
MNNDHDKQPSNVGPVHVVRSPCVIATTVTEANKLPQEQDASATTQRKELSRTRSCVFSKLKLQESGTETSTNKTTTAGDGTTEGNKEQIVKKSVADEPAFSSGRCGQVGDTLVVEEDNIVYHGAFGFGTTTIASAHVASQSVDSTSTSDNILDEQDDDEIGDNIVYHDNFFGEEVFTSTSSTSSSDTSHSSSSTPPGSPVVLLKEEQAEDHSTIRRKCVVQVPKLNLTGVTPLRVESSEVNEVGPLRTESRRDIHQEHSVRAKANGGTTRIANYTDVEVVAEVVGAPEKDCNSEFTVPESSTRTTPTSSGRASSVPVANRSPSRVLFLPPQLVVRSPMVVKRTIDSNTSATTSTGTGGGHCHMIGASRTDPTAATLRQPTKSGTSSLQHSQSTGKITYPSTTTQPEDVVGPLQKHRAVPCMRRVLEERKKRNFAQSQSTLISGTQQGQGQHREKMKQGVVQYPDSDINIKDDKKVAIFSSKNIMTHRSTTLAPQTHHAHDHLLRTPQRSFTPVLQSPRTAEHLAAARGTSSSSLFCSPGLLLTPRGIATGSRGSSSASTGRGEIPSSVSQITTPRPLVVGSNSTPGLSSPAPTAAVAGRYATSHTNATASNLRGQNRITASRPPSNNASPAPP